MRTDSQSGKNSLRFPLVSDHLLFRPEKEEDLWNGSWIVQQRDGTRDTIGSMRIGGSKVPGEVIICVDLAPEYRNRGYGAEIFYFMAKFVFRFRDLREICAVCEHENDRCVHALEKAGYVFREHKDGRDYYSMKRQKSAWAGLYLSVGITAGFVLGIVLSNPWVGTVAGVVTGAFVGLILDSMEKKSHPDARS
ncbi:MAG: GNAT family N-acetyltransferase [Lachnospiraceae bacterium]|nr:GNAT family N-acetyltransferase [Lachnospiraceae bacterium]